MYEKLFKLMQDVERNFGGIIKVTFRANGRYGYFEYYSEKQNLNNEFSSLEEAEQILTDMFSM